MVVTIGSNAASLTAQRRLGEATSALDKSYERLSSGQRINRASDDAAGLAISKTLDARAKIFNQGVRNLNDGISYTAIAGGAVKELKSILLRQRELATQSSNGTYSDRQREAMEVELKQLSSEWNRVLDSTAFNGRMVFSAAEGSLTLQAGIGADGVLEAAFGSEDAAAQDDTVTVWGAGYGDRPALSADGRYVVFSSAASDLVSGDTNGQTDVFIKDLRTGETRMVSTDSSGSQSDGYSGSPTVSADGRYVAFFSDASNLVSGGTSGTGDVFMKDLQSGETRRVSTDSSGAEGNGLSYEAAVSADGRYVVFSSWASDLVAGDANNQVDIFITDLQSGATRIVSTTSAGLQGNGSSQSAGISADGRYVAFYSYASDLVAGDTNGQADVFIKDLQTGETRIVSTDSSGVQGEFGSYAPSISADGRYVAFMSGASNLVAGDTNAQTDIFVKDLQTGETRLVSAASGGEPGDSYSYSPSISSDGRYVAFASYASNLLPGDGGQGDVFIKDLQTGAVAKASAGLGAEGDGQSEYLAISGDGRYVAFGSWATNLVAGDTNGDWDDFVTGNPLAQWSAVSRSQWLSVATREEALLAQTRLDAYLNELNAVEGALGALEARFAVAVSNLQSMSQNFRSAESRITDADMGQEAAQLTRIQIVQQAASAVLAQANQAPALALSLLR